MALTDALKIGATALSGLFAGSALYINTADIPATMTMENTAAARQHWKEAFNRAKIYQAGMALTASTTASLIYYLDEESESRMLWLVGSGLMFSIMPWTKLVMWSDIQKNLKEDVFETAGETWVRNHMSRWNKQHAVRTALSVSALGVFLYALSRK